ncbi:MAG: response regulator, partial [Kangiellaceae bacterium]
MRESQGTGITSRNRSIARNTVSGVSRSQLENRNSVTKLSPAEKSVSNNKNAKSSHKNTLINKLLVVDPDKDFSSIVADYLTLFGFQVAHRNTLVSALDYVKRESCDLIFLSDNFDQVHPISSLRKFKKISDSLIVVIATRGDDQLAVELIKAGASDYLSRRVKDNDILASLASLLERLGNQIEQELRESPNEFQDSNASAIHSTDDTEDKLGDRLVQFYEDMSQKSRQYSELPEIDQPRLRDRTDSIAEENFNGTHHQVNFDAPEHVDPRTNRAEIKRDSFNRPDLDSVDFGRAELDSRDIRRLDTLERDLNENSQSNEVFERLSLKSEFKSNEQVFSENQRSHTKRQDTANITDLPGNLISLDKDMNIDVINRSASRILGFSVQQNFQKSILEFIPSALQRSFQIEFDDFCQSSHTLDNVDSTSQKLFETVLMIANGQTIPVNCHLSCTETQYHDLDRPQLTRYLLSFEDISEVKSALAKQQYHAMWNSILHSYSYRFINLKLAEFSSELSDIISDTANFFKLDRVAIFLLDRSATSAKIYLEWLKSECASLKQFSKKIDVQKTAMEFEHLFAGKTQLLSPEGTIKESADLSCFGLSEHYAQVGALSSIILPLERHSMAEDKKIMGWLSLDYQTLNNQWNTEDLQLISPLSKLISEAFARRAQEEHRRVTHQKLSENHGRLS